MDLATPGARLLKRYHYFLPAVALSGLAAMLGGAGGGLLVLGAQALFGWGAHVALRRDTGPSRALSARLPAQLLLLGGYGAVGLLVVGVPLLLAGESGSWAVLLAVGSCMALFLVGSLRFWPGLGVLYALPDARLELPLGERAALAARLGFRLTRGDLERTLEGLPLVLGLGLLVLSPFALSWLPLGARPGVSPLVAAALALLVAPWVHGLLIVAVADALAAEPAPDGEAQREGEAPPGEAAAAPVASVAAAAGAGSLDTLRDLAEQGADLDELEAGRTALMAATTAPLASRRAVLEWLLDQGVDLAVRDARGWTALHHAAAMDDGENLRLLVHQGAELEALDRERLTPLAVACEAGAWSAARSLLELGASPAPRDGLLPLHLAATADGDDPEGVRLLHGAGAEIDARGKLGRTALMGAAMRGNAMVCSQLLEAGADVNARDDFGNTPLMEAARAGANGVLERLVLWQPETEHRDKPGRTALLVAVSSRRADPNTIRLLLAMGADREVRNRENRSAGELALAGGRWKLARALGMKVREELPAPPPPDPEAARVIDLSLFETPEDRDWAERRLRGRPRTELNAATRQIPAAHVAAGEAHAGPPAAPAPRDEDTVILDRVVDIDPGPVELPEAGEADDAALEEAGPEAVEAADLEPEDAGAAEAGSEDVGPEALEPEVAGPEIAEPEVAEPEPLAPEVAEPEAVGPAAVEPEVADPEVVEPGVAEAEVADAEIVEPEAVEPEVAGPEIAEPEVAEPEAVAPEVAGPEAVGSEALEPEVADREIVEPEAAEADVAGLEDVGPEALEAEVAGPEVAEPEAAAPEVAEPEVAEPEAGEPEVTEPEVADPEAVEREVTEPEVVEAEAAEPEVAGADAVEAPHEEVRDRSRAGYESLVQAALGDDIEQMETVLETEEDYPAWWLVEAFQKSVAAGRGISPRWLLERGLSASARDEHGRSLLSWAARRTPPSLEMVEALLERGAGSGDDPEVIHRLCGQPDEGLEASPAPDSEAAIPAMLAQLVEAGADPDFADARGRTPLHWAAACRGREVIERLVTLGAAVDPEDHLGNTPLMLAVTHERTSIARLLLKAGADPKHANDKGNSPLSVAMAGDDQTLIKMLMGAARSGPGGPRNRGRVDDLHQAAAVGNLGRVKRLLGSGANVQARDEKGCTALLRAAGEGHVNVVSALLAAGAEPGLAAANGTTPLGAAVLAGHLEVVKLLCDRGFDVDQRQQQDITPLMLAAARWSPRIASILLRSGADPNARDASEGTALMAAAQNALQGRDLDAGAATMKLLLKAGAETNAVNDEGQDALMLLCGVRVPKETAVRERNVLRLAEVLVAHGAQVDRQDLAGWSALHAAANHGLRDLAAWLLAHGASRRIRDINGLSPVDLAMDQSHEGLVDLFIRSG